MVVKNTILIRLISHWIVTKHVYVYMPTESQETVVRTCAPLLKTLDVEQTPSNWKYTRSM